MGRKKAISHEEDDPPGGAKSKKKALATKNNEDSIGMELDEDKLNQEESINPVAGKKKNKKGNFKSLQGQDEDEEKPMQEEEEEEDDDVPAVEIMGKKPSKAKKNGKKNLLTTSSFGLLDEENEDDEQSGLTVEKHESDGSEGGDVHAISFSGKKKKSSKSSKKTGSLFSAFDLEAVDDDVDAIDQSVDENNVGSDDETPVIAFTGKKKKKSKSNKKNSTAFALSSFDVLDEEDGDRVEKKDIDEEEEDEGAASITFTAKKKSSKSSKKSSNLFSAALLDEENDGDASVSEQLTASKSGDDAAYQFGVQDEDAEVVDKVADDLHFSEKVSEGVAETSKNKKKKKKKSGKTPQEEDDLDKLLAELGEGYPMSKPAAAAAPPSREEKIEVQPEPVGLADATAGKEGEDEGVESAAAKKKKKKKEKEKEKKAAAVEAAAAAAREVKEENTQEKKKNLKNVPKHVREMQEALARRKEAEERKKREEEERLRKEEEERRRQEELERQAEEAKRRKKEREKEKLLKKKQEGRLLTGKQKEEARRLEQMRNQILANAGALPLSTADAVRAPAKRPIYQTKKTKPPSVQANGAVAVKPVESIDANESLQETVCEVDSLETEKVEELNLNIDEKSEEVVEENGVEEDDEDADEDEDEDEWDAKSWDDAVLNLREKSAFADEEADLKKPEPLVRKETKSVTTKKVSSQAIKSQDTDSKKGQFDVENSQRNKSEAGAKKVAPKSDAPPKSSENNLRSPICCIMGHVDTGKTKLLDCIRGTNVQEGEAGGITQQIGATYFPIENIRERTKELKADAEFKVPGLLIIDTPGHESFNNLRSRGSGLCDIAILVVDIMHGLEPQTIESLNLLKMRNTEFIIALNKVDRLYGWKVCRNAPIVKAMKQQSKDVQNEFNMRLAQIIAQFQEQGLNTELYYKKKEMGETYKTYHIVPTSAISGEGIPNLLFLLVEWAQRKMVEKLTFSDDVQCTVLEVKVVEGHGTTIDVVLVNGVLHEGDQIVVCGMQGPIVTVIRALLTPHPMKELRVKGTYLHHREIKAAQCIKITAQGLEHAIAGTSLYVVASSDDLEDVMEVAMEDVRSVMSRIDKSGEGVYVQASTLGSLEALLEFLKSPAVSIPVSGIGIGPVHKKDVMKASVMLEKKKEFATILAFDVKVTPEARELADDVGVKIFIADIIYHLFDQFKAYISNLKEEKKREAADEAVFPCVLKIIPNCVFNKKDPIVLGVDVLEGIARVGTPICVPQRDFTDIGRIASIEFNHKPVDLAKKGQKVAIKIVGSSAEEQQKMFGRHFEIDDELVSHISRKSIDVLKANYRDDLTIEEWRLVVKLKNLFKIQ
ncbi:eukaryotic translation initiation factor 5B-like [Malania oleifera]|uniref:eukaryotic translation initiation factor 5B-like n=1 Tax=Malania oleifera TaxID=397392 RepID=UPI0025AE015C|nr:eukaryotic translation initiation factor 5B-like [Malania oleifera]XP_057949348.1 eukaryotic translation initiation factor 5B-like [Malania oleifera]XP_057949349.1 eukaryotic translation initiation factor 5B-like [Malania oleifera]XP_057949350.1 eukaryotic translation initiation factor 5B-like [Malania oleifera]